MRAEGKPVWYLLIVKFKSHRLSFGAPGDKMRALLHFGPRMKRSPLPEDDVSQLCFVAASNPL
jgi:hypothetical protein